MTTKTTKAADNAEKLTPATEAAASGAIIEPEMTKIDPDHPSIDSTPRERSTPEMNQIDMNVPSAVSPEQEQVAANLGAKED